VRPHQPQRARQHRLGGGLARPHPQQGRARGAQLGLAAEEVLENLLQPPQPRLLALRRGSGAGFGLGGRGCEGCEGAA
jgi:hypothetical protein